jgi:hypothetical protein
LYFGPQEKIGEFAETGVGRRGDEGVGILADERTLQRNSFLSTK